MSVLRLAVLGTLLTVAAPAGATTTEHFQLRTGADLVALCATPGDDPLYPAAIHFCHGFGAGVYQTMIALTNHEKLTPLFCPPTPPPSRNDGLARFLAWSKQRPEHLTGAPADVVGRFLVEEFPCPKTTAGSPAKKK